MWSGLFLYFSRFRESAAERSGPERIGGPGHMTRPTMSSYLLRVDRSAAIGAVFGNVDPSDFAAAL